jgi:hypothetical protein
MRALLLTFLTGCSLMAGTHSSTLSSPSTPSRPVDDRVTAQPDPSAPKYLENEQFHALRGLTVEQAKAKAKSFGHTGKVTVEEMDEFLDDCKPNTVCRATDERGGQQSMHAEEPLVLRTTKTLSIAAPPPSDD